MTYKALNDNDSVSTRTLLHEAIPLTGTIVSGTYSDNNIKNYAHGMFQSVYDYPYLSSSANHIFDITIGIGANSSLYSSVASQQSKKKNVYNQMAQVLMGYDATGSVQRFDEDGDLLLGGEKIDDAIIVPFSRLLTKDEIKKETFELTLGVSASYLEPFGNTITISDVGASTEYRANSPAGEYGILYATASSVILSSWDNGIDCFCFWRPIRFHKNWSSRSRIQSCFRSYRCRLNRIRNLSISGWFQK